MKIDNQGLLVNGQPQMHIDVRDRGLQYGDGLFETMAYHGGGIRFFDRHYRRLATGCERLGLIVPPASAIKSDVERLNLGESRCVVKVVITRGVGGFGYTPNESKADTTRIVQVLPWPSNTPQQDNGLVIDVLATCLASSPLLAGIKHLNRLEQVMAAREIDNRKLDEGLVCTQDGFIIEAVSSNVIFVFDEHFVTPKLDVAGVAGIAREAIIDQALLDGEVVSEEYLYADVVQQADEVILCNSIRGCRPARQVGERKITARGGFQRLDAWFQSA